MKKAGLADEGLNLESNAEKNLSTDLKDVLISSYIALRKYDDAKRHIDKKSLQGQLYLAHIAMLNQQLDKAEKIIKRLLKHYQTLSKKLSNVF